MNCFKKYRVKKRRTWIGKYFQRLVFTWKYKIFTALALIGISIIGFKFVAELSVWGVFFNYVFGIGLISLCIIALIFIIAGIYFWIKDDILNSNQKK